MNNKNTNWYNHTEGRIAILSALAIFTSLILRLFDNLSLFSDIPLFIAYAFGGSPLIIALLKRLKNKDFGSDLLAGISIITAILLGEYLAGTIVILMLSGGEALEEYALKNASAVLDALAKRMPQFARLKTAEGVKVTTLDQVKLGDLLEVLPHDIAPVDGEVVDGHGSMDESYLTGEPFNVPKTVGSTVLSGAINGEDLLVIRATALPIDSRYQKIAQVIESQASKQVPMRRIGDMIGAWYTPIALLIAIGAYFVSGDPTRFLAVLVIATPCPLLIAIPIAIIGSISLLAKRGIIVKTPAALEQVSSCRTLILDKTGTLTYGTPALSKVDVYNGFDENKALSITAALEAYSKHPLSVAIREEADKRGLKLPDLTSISEAPGKGLRGVGEGSEFLILGRKQLGSYNIENPQTTSNELECFLLVNEKLAAGFHFTDKPRKESKKFVSHIGIDHQFTKVMILSGDRKESVEALAKLVNIKNIEAGLSPEEKVVRVQEETKKAKTLYIGDGINDAPALQMATVGIAIGTKSDITSEAADIVVLEASLEKVDEFLDIGINMKKIALQSAVGGMFLSFIGMLLASAGLINPLSGAILQEVIDVLAILNALRAVAEPKILSHKF